MTHSRFPACAAVLYCTIGVMLCREGHAQDRATDSPPRFALDEFAKHAESLGCTARQSESFRRLANREDAAVAMDDLLRSMFPVYRRAATLAEAFDPRGAIRLARLLDTERDPYAVAFARYKLARTFLAADDPEDAAAVFAEFRTAHRGRTPLDADVQFFLGVSLAAIPDRERAIRELATFLREFPRAPERQRSGAAQLKAELEQREGELHELSDIMAKCRRDIRDADTGLPTQREQKRVIDRLQRLIEEWERRESSVAGAPGGGGGPPAGRSALPNGPEERGSRRARAASSMSNSSMWNRWGEIKPAERAAIEAELHGKIPPRYRKMLEQYFERLGRRRR